MREIKFRAWDTQWREFQYSGYGIKTFALFTKRTNCERYKIGQYTGLKDSNGREIYEGDVVEGRYTQDMGEINLIKWGDSSFCVYGIAQNGDKVGFACCPSEAKILKVIGNIHENPELLK